MADVGDTWYFNTTSSGRTGSIQNFDVPEPGTYRILAEGAAGADGDGNGAGYGGDGAQIEGEFELDGNQSLSILVGQKGIDDTNDGGGGGGGSFVADENDNPLIVAGGGGGAAAQDTANGALDGGDGRVDNDGDIAGNEASSDGAGGGSFSQNGEDGSATGGEGFLNGGYGGMGENTTDGGFGGGGGGGSQGGGGAGGYTGGDAGYDDGGEGGGSYNDGANQNNLSGYNGGGGFVEVELIEKADTTPPTVPSNLTSSNTGSSSTDLSWDASSDSESGVDHYNIYEDGSKLKEVTQNSTTISGKSPGSSSDYYVTAVDGLGNESSASNTIIVRFGEPLGANLALGKGAGLTAETETILGNWRGYSDGKVTQRTQEKVEGEHAQKWQVAASKTTDEKAVYRADGTIDVDLATALSTTSGEFTQGTFGFHIRVDDSSILSDTDALQLKIGSSSSDYAVWTLDRSELGPDGEFEYYTFSHDDYDEIVGSPDWTNADFYELTAFEESGNSTDTFIYVDYFTVGKGSKIGANGIGDRRSSKRTIRTED